jgi:BirA family biotin operon repressor/biotin-[acetyl-CoA-carboxylase] ligase
METAVIAWQIHWFDSLASTNTYLREWVADSPALVAGTVVAAREQTAGRGRQDRRWVGAAGRDLAFTFLLRESVPVDRLPSLPMAAALGVAAYLEGECGLAARVKWPNDVRVNGRKICGILAESVAAPGPEPQTVVVGIGINVNMPPEIAESIEPPATSVFRETRAERDVALTQPGGVERVGESLEVWRSGGFDALRGAWLERCEFLGEAVSVQGANGALLGRLEGFDGYGALIVQDESGKRHTITAGDVSLRVRDV